MPCPCAPQGGDAAEGTCPLCRGNLTPAKMYTRAQLRALAPAPIELDCDEEEEKEGTPPEGRGEAVRLFVSSTKLDAIVAALEQSRA